MNFFRKRDARGVPLDYLDRRAATPENAERRKEIDALAAQLDAGEKRAVEIKIADAQRRAFALLRRVEAIKASARAIRRAPQ